MYKYLFSWGESTVSVLGTLGSNHAAGYQYLFQSEVLVWPVCLLFVEIFVHIVFFRCRDADPEQPESDEAVPL